MTYKKEDLPKAILLVVLIIATFWLSFHFLLGPGASPARPKQLAAARTAPGTPAPAAAGEELFAPREHSTSELLARAQSSPDPFRPAVVADVVHTAPEPRAAAAAAPPRPKEKAPAPTALPQGPTLRLVGVISSGARPTAVLVGDDGRHYVQIGDSVSGGWRVLRLGPRSIELAKGQQHATLTLTREQAPTAKPVPPLGK